MTTRPSIAGPSSAIFGPAIAGAAATFSGIGLSRFAFVPLFPAMVSAGWVSGPEGGLLGAFNLGGYLAGVLGGRRLASRLGTARALDTGMALVVLAFAACAWNGGVAWLAAWRLVAGSAGGLLMALAGPAVQETVAPDRRGRAGGIVVSGVGFGIIAGSTVVPASLGYGLSSTWLALAGLVAIVWLVARPAWPTRPLGSPGPGRPARAAILSWGYGLSGAGLVPHMVYFADLAVRGRGLSLGTGTLVWTLFGAGTLAGAVGSGRIVDRLGGETTFRIWLAIQVAALAASLVAIPSLLFASAFLGGVSALGLTTIALARARELAGAGAGLIWVRVTAAFAVAQAIAGFGLAALFGRTHSHDQIFLAGLGLSILALLVSLVGRDGEAVAP